MLCCIVVPWIYNLAIMLLRASPSRDSTLGRSTFRADRCACDGLCFVSMLGLQALRLDAALLPASDMSAIERQLWRTYVGFFLVYINMNMRAQPLNSKLRPLCSSQNLIHTVA